MRKTAGLTGLRFGRLTVRERAVRASPHAYWLCVCDCGKPKAIRGTSLLRGTTRSCGCMVGPLTRQRSTRHGKSRSSIYHRWRSMLARCENPKHDAWNNYGGRGIKVCARWHDFEDFYTDVGDPPPGMTLDRERNDEDYGPDNFRWASIKTQQRNRRSVPTFTFQGRTADLVGWAEVLGCSRGALYRRYVKGWSVERMLSTPIQTRTR